MMNTPLSTRKPLAMLGFALMLSSQGLTAAETLHLLPPQQGDFSSEQLTDAVPTQPIANKRREGVDYSWPLRTDQPLALVTTPHKAHSKLYWIRVAGDELSKGIPIEVSAAQAVVRISPLAPPADSPEARGPALAPERLELIQGSRSLHGQAAMEALAGQEQLAATGSPFPPGTTAFRLTPNLGSGLFLLSTSQSIPSDAQYLVEVVDQHSDTVMTLQTDATSYLQGQTLHATLTLEGKQGQSAIDSASAYLLSPSGKRYPAVVSEAAHGAYRADIDLNEEPSRSFGLWELHAALHGKGTGGPIRRNAKTAFSLSSPHAKLHGQVQVKKNDSGDLTASLTAEVTAASRYVLRGVLYGSDAEGNMKPIAVSETARWIEAGEGQLALVFNAGELAGSGLQAPYELRDLQLSDQGRMTVQYRQQRALVIN